MCLFATKYPGSVAHRIVNSSEVMAVVAVIAACPDLPTRARMCNKSGASSLLYKRTDFLPSTALAYGWGWDGGRA